MTKLNKILSRLARIAFRLTTLGLKKGPHITRYFMYLHLSKYSSSHLQNERLLSISHSEHLGKLLGFSDNQIMDASYPEFTILRLPFQDCKFDAVVSDQVLEHVEGSPELAVQESFRVLKVGGIVLHTTCFINPIHLDPKDFWRFTPDALKMLAEKHGEVVDFGGWGNPFVWIYVAFGLRSERIPHLRLHPAHWLAMKNNKKWPIVTWVLARKTAIREVSP